MDARPISDPIHLFDCVMPCAGAEAFLVMSEERARDLGLPHVAAARRDRAPQRLSPTIRCMVRGGWRVDRDDLYAQAGVQPGATSTSCRPTTTIRSIVMLQFEDLGFCDKGEGPAFVRAHDAHHRRRLSRTTPAAASSRPARPARPAASSA